MKLIYIIWCVFLCGKAFGQNIPQKGNLGVKLSVAKDNPYKAIFSIAEVSENSTAENLGLQAQDILVKINNVLFDDQNRISEVIGKFVVGEKVTAQVLRADKIVKLKGKILPPPAFKKSHHNLELLEIPFREGFVRGYLTSPKGEGPFPTVYYIQGYPCQSINNHPQSPVLQLTSGLVDLGYAVFRIEKPGVGEFSNLSPCNDYLFDDEVENFNNGLSFIKNNKKVDASKIYLFGHSLGGNVAPILAQNNTVSGVITFGTLVKRWEDYLLDMAYYSQTYSQDAISVVQDIPTLKSANNKLYVQNLSHTELSKKEKLLLQKWHAYTSDGTVFNRKIEFWQNFNTYNYLKEWSKVENPVLTLYGESDAHAISFLDSELIALNINQNHAGNATFQLIENTNHLLANVTSRAQELENISSGIATQIAFTQFNQEIPSIIHNWINGKRKQTTLQQYQVVSKLFPRAETNMSSMDVVAADFNNDGKDDLVLATEFGPNKLFLFENGSWKNYPLPELKSYTPPYLGEDSEDIAVADFDKDGDLDLFFISEDTKNHELLLNDGKGSFTFSKTQITKKGIANAVLVYDFNQDGWEDILIGIRGQNELYINNKGNGFTDETLKYWNKNQDHTQDLILVDIDNDSDLDILEGIEQGNNNLYVNENGKFVEQSERLPLPDGLETRKIVATDFDNDGDQDLFYCNVGWNPQKNPQNQLLINDGKGNFSNVTNWLPKDDSTTLDALFTDINNDGITDMITTNFVNDEKVKIFLGKKQNEAYRFEINREQLPNINFYGGTSVLNLSVDDEEFIYFANFKSNDVLLKRKS